MERLQKCVDGKTKPLSFSIAAILGEDFFNSENSTKKFTCQSKEKYDDCRENQTPARIKEEGQCSAQKNGDAFPLQTAAPKYSWLECSRYKPPKVPRSKRKGGIMTRPSRQPRIPFTPFQQSNLESKFKKDHYLTPDAVKELSMLLDLPEQRIKIWFQNRRARERRENQQKPA